MSSKGIAIGLADGISSSDVSHIASQAAVTGFLEDYFCTSEAWSVKKSVQRVLIASNSWLYAQTRQSRYCYDMDRGYVCTLSAMVIKSTTAHIFHVGDSIHGFTDYATMTWNSSPTIIGFGFRRIKAIYRLPEN
ncbi:protein phosphatase 2C domain-containing protein [Methylobacter svalbardensis]|uniref:protein phosphatase 2C domain-containing protein n=1 Tax=Methylobacter svalbardensis TaxID=3080016 RepID=UPI0030EB7F3B